MNQPSRAKRRRNPEGIRRRPLTHGRVVQRRRSAMTQPLPALKFPPWAHRGRRRDRKRRRGRRFHLADPATPATSTETLYLQLLQVFVLRLGALTHVVLVPLHRVVRARLTQLAR